MDPKDAYMPFPHLALTTKSDHIILTTDSNHCQSWETYTAMQ